MLFNKKTKTDKAGEMILSQHISLSLDTRATRKNCNTLIVGPAGCAPKAHYFLPNLLQKNCSYVVVDKEGTLQEQTEQVFRENGYEVKVLDVAHPETSNKYNPFSYIREDTDVLGMVDALTKNFTKKGTLVGADLALQCAQRCLLHAIVFYLYKECWPSERTLANLVKLLDCAEARANDPDYISALDIIFDNLEATSPDHIAVLCYRRFKECHPAAAQKVIVDTKVNLALFKLNRYAELTATDELDIPSIGLKPTVLYIKPTITDQWPANRLLLPLFFSQLLETLYFTADTKCEKQRLPVHVRLMFTNFQSYFAPVGGREFSQHIAIMKPYKISCDLFVHNIEQLKTAFPEEWKTIVGNYDEVVYLAGGQVLSGEDVEWLSNRFQKDMDRINKLPIKESIRKCQKRGIRILKGAKPLASVEELTHLKLGDCVVSIRGQMPMVDKVYDPERHPHYKYVEDAVCKAPDDETTNADEYPAV